MQQNCYLVRYFWRLKFGESLFYCMRWSGDFKMPNLCRNTDLFSSHHTKNKANNRVTCWMHSYPCWMHSYSCKHCLEFFFRLRILFSPISGYTYEMWQPNFACGFVWHSVAVYRVCLYNTNDQLTLKVL